MTIKKKKETHTMTELTDGSCLLGHLGDSTHSSLQLPYPLPSHIDAAPPCLTNTSYPSLLPSWPEKAL
jgi:hypothetical protein